MRIICFVLPAVLSLTACSHTYYVVRHAEKAAAGDATVMMKDDLPLTEAGKNRALALKDALQDKNIRNIFSTNTTRTKLTAEPLRAFLQGQIKIYARADSAFIASLKKLKRNTLVVGHSNTVDDIVNGLCNKNVLSDLNDPEYDNLFEVVYRKKLFGTKIKYTRKKYGTASQK